MNMRIKSACVRDGRVKTLLLVAGKTRFSLECIKKTVGLAVEDRKKLGRFAICIYILTKIKTCINDLNVTLR